MIYKTITNDYEFWDWLEKSSNYGDNFTINGAKALQEYLGKLSDLDKDIEFDPIAWCSEYSEYDNALEAYNVYHGEDDEGVGTAIGEDNTEENANAQALEWLREHTTVITIDELTTVVVRDF